jgi:nicotinamidase-related amidase
VSTLDLSVQYFQDSPVQGLPWREEHFVRRSVSMQLPVAQTALVLVDTWDNHFIESWLERAERMTREAVVPVLHSGRQAGLTIVHAPSPSVTPAFPDHMKQHKPAPAASPPDPTPDWPPADFRSRQGEYSAFRGPRAQPPGIPDIEIGMSPHIDVLDEDFLLETGQQLHELCRARGILHLIYAGFATNWCILNRDYGMRSMAGFGYNMILLREATMGVEYPDTVDECFATELAIREVETQIGFTASNADYLAACGEAEGG